LRESSRKLESEPKREGEQGEFKAPPPRTIHPNGCGSFLYLLLLLLMLQLLLLLRLLLRSTMACRLRCNLTGKGGG